MPGCYLVGVFRNMLLMTARSPGASRRPEEEVGAKEKGSIRPLPSNHPAECLSF